MLYIFLTLESQIQENVNLTIKQCQSLHNWRQLYEMCILFVNYIILRSCFTVLWLTVNASGFLNFLFFAHGRFIFELYIIFYSIFACCSIFFYYERLNHWIQSVCHLKGWIIYMYINVTLVSFNDQLTIRAHCNFLKMIIQLGTTFYFHFKGTCLQEGLDSAKAVVFISFQIYIVGYQLCRSIISNSSLSFKILKVIKIIEKNGGHLAC